MPINNKTVKDAKGEEDYLAVVYSPTGRTFRAHKIFKIEEASKAKEFARKNNGELHLVSGVTGVSRRKLSKDVMCGGVEEPLEHGDPLRKDARSRFQVYTNKYQGHTPCIVWDEKLDKLVVEGLSYQEAMHKADGLNVQQSPGYGKGGKVDCMMDRKKLHAALDKVLNSRGSKDGGPGSGPQKGGGSNSGNPPFSYEDIQTALKQGRHDLAMEMSYKNRLAAKKAGGKDGRGSKDAYNAPGAATPWMKTGKSSEGKMCMGCGKTPPPDGKSPYCVSCRNKLMGKKDARGGSNNTAHVIALYKGGHDPVDISKVTRMPEAEIRKLIKENYGVGNVE